MTPEYPEGLIEEAIVHLLNRKGDKLYGIKNPTDKMIMVSLNGSKGASIKHVETPKPEHAVEAVRLNFDNIKLIYNFSEETKEALLYEWPSKVIQELGERAFTTAQLERAIKINHECIEHIHDASEELQLLALKCSQYAWTKFRPKNVTINVKLEIFARNRYDALEETLQRLRTNNDHYISRRQMLDVDCQYGEQIMRGDSQYKMIRFITNPTVKQQLAFAERFLKYLKHERHDISNVRKFIKARALCLEVAQMVLADFPRAFDDTEYLSATAEDIQIARIRISPSVISYVKSPSEKLVRIAAEVGGINALISVNPKCIPSDLVEKYYLDVDAKLARKFYLATDDDDIKMHLAVKYSIKPPKARKGVPA
jgi:hypothetical protein